MPIEDLVKNHELLAKVLSHYRHQLESLHSDRGLESSMSNAMKENLSFTHTVRQIEQLLSLRGLKAREEAKKYSGLMTLAVSGYVKDCEVVLEKARALLPDLPDGDLHRLETELKTIKAYITQ
jgi:hypothetical protein